MSSFVIFNIQFGMNFVIALLATRWFVLPFLYRQPLKEALSLLLLIGGLRHFGLTFTVPMLTNNLPSAFAYPSAYGDFAVSILALLVLLVLRLHPPLGMKLAWVYVVVGSVDLVYAFYLGFANQMWLSFGPVWLVVIFLAPTLTIAMGLVAVLLLRHPEVAAGRR